LADKPGSVEGNHSSGTRIAPRLKQPTRRLRRAADVNAVKAIDVPAYLALLRVGFTLPSVLPRPRWALTSPFQPCLIRSLDRPSAVSFLLHFPSPWAGVCTLDL